MNMLIGVLVMILCLVLQAVLASLSIHYYGNRRELVIEGGPLVGLLVIIAVMLLLLAGNFAQIAIWGGLFQLLGEFDDYAVAFYHSAVNFATLGYGDIVMSDAHRILGPLQAVNGVLMIGVSTAVLMATLQDAMRGRFRG
jgi:hypothetical protein